MFELRWLNKKVIKTIPAMRGGSPVIGGKSQKVTTFVTVLQYKDSGFGGDAEWHDVPTEQETQCTNTSKTQTRSKGSQRNF